jgi:hypothetical protein
VTSFVNRDRRIRLIRQSNCGLSAARNAGIAATYHEWLLFLDADDWISPLYLQTLTDTLRADPQLDAVHCLSVRVTPEGTHIVWDYVPPSGDLFPTLAKRVAFAVHACIVRKSLVTAVGQFDTSLRHVADWDLWQRIARTGARFGAVPEVLAYYRMQQHSLSLNPESMVKDALRVLERGHRADPRVRNPARAHAGGAPAEELNSQVFYLVCWSAGVLLGRGEDARSLLDQIKGYTCTTLSADGIAECIFESAILPSCWPVHAWEDLWPVIAGNAETFFLALEEHSGTPELSWRAQVCLRIRIIKHLLGSMPSSESAGHPGLKRQALLTELESLESELAKDLWWLRVGPNSSATLTIERSYGHAARVVIGRAATANSYDIQLNRPRFEARERHRLAVQFKARADGSRSMFVGFSQGHEPWTGLGLYRRVNLTPDWQSFQEEFVAAADDHDARIHFDLGDSDIAVDVASVGLVSLDSDGNAG